jgi:hypothetical protein
MNIPNSIHSSNETNKLIFIYNAIEKGWSVRKKGKVYIFSRKHNNDCKYLKSSYIYEFIKSNISSYF